MGDWTIYDGRYVRHTDWIPTEWRCLDCNLQFSYDLLGEHNRLQHPEAPPSQPAQPTINNYYSTPPDFPFDLHKGLELLSEVLKILRKHFDK